MREPFPYVNFIGESTDFDTYILYKQCKILLDLDFEEIDFIEGFSGISFVYNIKEFMESLELKLKDKKLIK